MESWDKKDTAQILLTIPACLRILSSQGYILRRYQSELDKDEYAINEKGKDLLNSEAKSTREEKSSQLQKISFVVTKPPFLYSKIRDLNQTFEIFIEIINKSKRKLWILSPYIDKNLLSMFHENFRRAFEKKDLDFKLIISNINRSSVMAVDFLQQIAVASGREKLPVRVFCEKTTFREGNVNNTARTKFSHAKLYISDNLALVTSANMNSESFISNVEIGVLFRDDSEALSTLSDIFQVIWINSNPFEKYIK